MNSIPGFLQRFSREVRRALSNHRYERTTEGIILPNGIRIGGQFGHQVNGGPMIWEPNLVVNEGLNHILDTVLHNQAQIPTWFVALFAGNVTPVATWTAANFTSLSTEFVNYTEATRPEYNEAAAAAQSITNSANKAVFTIDTGGGTVYGAALISSSVKSGVAGKLFAATRFATQRTLDATDLLNVAYTVGASST